MTILNLFFGGILAGIEIVIHYGLRRPSETLDDRAQLQLRQALVRRLRVLVPAFFLPTVVSAITVAIVEWRGPDFWPRGVGLAALLIWIAIRVVGTVPINQATLAWSLDAPPQDWRARVDHAERFHTVGVWMAVIAFAASLAASAMAR